MYFQRQSPRDNITYLFSYLQVFPSYAKVEYKSAEGGAVAKMKLSALKGLLRERGVLYQDVAKAINISASSLGRKINGGNFTAAEVDSVAEYLKLDPRKINKYFFP